jgi:hypothetical protein
VQLTQTAGPLEFTWMGLSPSFDVQVSIPTSQAGLISSEVTDTQGFQSFNTPFVPLGLKE